VSIKEFFTRHFSNTEESFVNPSFILKIAGVALSLFFLTFFLFSWTMDTVVHSRKEVIVPDIQGKSAANALQLISEGALAMKIDGYEFNDSVPIGTVLRQAPSAGTTVREGKIVKVVFSQGGESVFTPNLIGLPLRNAELLLRQRQLLLGEVSESYSLKAEKGTVLSQEPKSEMSVSKNTMVQVVVAAGIPPAGIVLMPDFRQKKIEETYQWASDNKVEIKTIEDSGSLFPGGTVIDQVPAADSVVSAESPVTLTVSARKASAGQEDKEYHVRYNVSQGGSRWQIRIVAVSKQGDREIFNGLREPGSTIDIAIPYSGVDKVRIFANGILVQEQELK